MNKELFSVGIKDYVADKGKGFLVLKPNSKVRTNRLRLDKEVKTIKVYDETQSGIQVEVGSYASEFFPVDENGLVELEEKTDTIYVRFVNTTSKKKEVTCMGVLI